MPESNQQAGKKTFPDLKFDNFMEQAPMGICVLEGERFVAIHANEAYLQVVDQTAGQFVGKSIFESLPEVKDSVEGLLKNVFTTGIPYHGVEFPVNLNRFGRTELAYFNFTYQPYRDEHGVIQGIMVICVEVSQFVFARHAIAESERQFRSMVMQSPVAMTIFRGPDHVIETANHVLFEKIWRKNPDDVLNKPALEVFPELNDQKYPELLKKVYHTGITHTEKESVAYVQGNDGMRRFFLDFEYRPLFEPDNSISGIIITVNDVTAKVEARLQAEESERRTNLVIDASGLGTWEWNLQTDEMKFSDRFAELFGYLPHEKIPHNTLVTAIHPDDLEIRKAAFEEAYKNSVLQYEARLFHTSGEIKWFQTKGKLLFDETGKPSLMMGTIRDITAEKTHNVELENRERKFRLLADSMPQIVWTADAEGNLNYFNKSLYNFTGLTTEKVMNSDWVSFVHPDDIAANINAWNESVASGKDYIFEQRFKTADGHYRWQLSRAIPQKDASGNIRMWVGTSTDIHEIKELDEQKDLFIGIASHELKTPITTIKGYVQLLQTMYSDGKDAFLENSLQAMHKQVVTITDLISDLLDVSKIRSGNLQIQQEVFDIREMIHDVLQNTRQTNPFFDFIVNINAKDVLVSGDKNKLSQVLINFLTNAIKYSPETKQINIGMEETSDSVKISVRDSGIGISKSDQDRIFERFYRVEGKEENTFPGFGIGLFIAAEIIKQHNGTIGVTSELGKGSTFYFSLAKQHK